jgi:hypothetical protein
MRVVFEPSPSWTRGELTPAAEYLVIKAWLVRHAHLFDRNELAQLLADLESGQVEARWHGDGISLTRGAGTSGTKS